MSIINPEKIVFETNVDIIDYVTRGLPPTKKNFEKVISKVINPDPDENSTCEVGKNVYIPGRLFFKCDNDTMEQALTRVYENRIHNRNMMLAAAGVVIAGIIFGSIKSNSKKKEDEINSISDVDMSTSPNVTI